MEQQQQQQQSPITASSSVATLALAALHLVRLACGLRAASTQLVPSAASRLACPAPTVADEHDAALFMGSKPATNARMARRLKDDA